MKYQYVFISLASGRVPAFFINSADTKKAATRGRKALAERGCPVGPIVRVHFPAMRAKERGE